MRLSKVSSRPSNCSCDRLIRIFLCGVVSKAFQILSDPQKRAAFDQSGGDPDSRFAGMSPGFAGGRQFQGEVSPEDLFNMFFGGGGQMGGGPFGGGPGESTQFGAISQSTDGSSQYLLLLLGQVASVQHVCGHVRRAEPPTQATPNLNLRGPFSFNLRPFSSCSSSHSSPPFRPSSPHHPHRIRRIHSPRTLHTLPSASPRRSTYPTTSLPPNSLNTPYGTLSLIPIKTYRRLGLRPPNSGSSSV